MSIRFAQPPFPCEIIVVDDGSPSESAARNRANCEYWPNIPDVHVPLTYRYIDRAPGYRNPSAARNVAYRMAKGEVIICQSDDVVHALPDTIECLVNDLHKGEFLVATVLNRTMDNRRCPKPLPVFTGPLVKRPLFFLGSLFRSDLYRVGGNDEEFAARPAFDDDWFGDCLIHGANLTPVYSQDIIGFHLDHARPEKLVEMVVPNEQLYRRKVADARVGKIPWCATGGPWPL